MAMDREHIIQLVKDHDVRYIRLQFTDLFGTVKNVELPVSQLAKVLDNKVMFDGSSIEGFVRIEESDMYLYPDLDTFLIFPWTEGKGKVARFICDIYHPDGTPFEGDPRLNLKRVLKEMEAMGYTAFHVGAEPEFFLFKLDGNGEPTLELNDHGGYFDLAPTDLGENCRREIVQELEEMGFEVEASHHEVAPGQHEIDFKYESALKACDDIQTFKIVVKTIAHKHGLLATFMPKPIAGINGSGMHCHLSLFKDGENMFYDPNRPLELSETAMGFIAGILEHAPAFTAVTNPTVNSYKRLVPGYEAPCYVAWSARNRSPLIRIPASRGMGTRVEVRSVDPSTNPYLAMSVLLASGLDGIKRCLKAPEPVDQNIYAMTEAERKELGIIDLPTNLAEALELMQKDQVITDALGAHILRRFLEAKEIEWDQYRTQVHSWEREKYLSQY
mgnify:CR=1 FL=1|jgi:L-glutamine synthetase (EC 6.3.1.2)